MSAELDSFTLNELTEVYELSNHTLPIPMDVFIFLLLTNMRLTKMRSKLG